jgi:hypothetical protein
VIDSGHTPYWYGIGAVISVYQAYRGFMFQWIFGIDVKGSMTRKVLLLCLADSFTYFVCAASGFVALFVGLNAARNDPVGFALLVYGILGITGKLPDILHKVGFPPQR